jgi:predicted nucleotidyltransferase
MAPMAHADVEGALKRVLAHATLPGLVSAYLFGSHADGRVHRESDVDVGCSSIAGCSPIQPRGSTSGSASPPG